MAELELLGTVYGGAGNQVTERQARITERLAEWCAKLPQSGCPEEFLVQSIIRQFRRYCHPLWHEGRREWAVLAASALQALGDSRRFPAIQIEVGE